MNGPNVDSSRRTFLKAAAGAATASAATGTAEAAEDGGGGGDSGGGGGGGRPDFDGFLSSANNYDDSVADERGASAVTVNVGAGEGFAFGPAAVWVDVGTTVTWEWTGEGGAHNVVGDGNDIDSGSAVAEEGATYEFTFEEGGIYNYFCNPHRGQGMLGGVAVGDDVPMVQPDTGGGGPTVPTSAQTIGVAASAALASTLGLTYIFMRYGGDFQEDV